MQNKYRVVIGVENHIQLKTNSKMFSAGPISFGKSPNSQVHPMDIGYPGVLPTVNKKGVELAILACHALHMKIDTHMRFDRKNYYYSDLSKGFQITQQFNPIGRDGYIDICFNSENKRIDIERLHIEEDTAKQIHTGGYSGLDYNRSGIGLIEVVSQPVMHSADEVVSYVKKLREIVIFSGISDGKMAEGSFRCDVNISLQTNTELISHKVEIKNLNSFANIRTAVQYEIKRQSALFDKGESITQSTRRFDEKTQTTILMRTKESDVDYRFFTEPNIQPIALSKTWITELKNQLPLLPGDIRSNLTQKYKLPMKGVNLLLQDVRLWHLFEQTLPKVKNYKVLLNLIIGDILSYYKTNIISDNDFQLKPHELSILISKMDDDQISSKQGKFILQHLLKGDLTVDNIIKKYQIVYINDRGQLEPIVNKVLQANQDFLTANANNAKRIEKFLIGKIMQVTAGNCSPRLVKTIITEHLKSLTE